MQNLIRLKNQIQNCNKCPLYNQIPNGMLPQFGFGSTTPDIMIVVPNVDYHNMMVGKPITVEEEMSLLEATKQVGIQNNVYITPLVKCGKITDGIKNAKVCCNWIYQEIEVLSVKHVIFMGQSLSRFYDMDWKISKSFFPISAFTLFKSNEKIRKEFTKMLGEIKDKYGI